MARKGHKFLCVVLCVALILTTALVGAFSAFAVTDEEAETVGASGDVVYVKVNNGWSNLNCYMWRDGQGNNAQWPGAAMQAVSDGVYAYTVTGNFSKIIFNNGNSGNGNQTSDMSYPAAERSMTCPQDHGLITATLPLPPRVRQLLTSPAAK